MMKLMLKRCSTGDLLMNYFLCDYFQLLNLLFKNTHLFIKDACSKSLENDFLLNWQIQSHFQQSLKLRKLQICILAGSKYSRQFIYCFQGVSTDFSETTQILCTGFNLMSEICIAIFGELITALTFFLELHFVYMAKYCYTDWNLCSSYSNMRSILLCYTR